MYRVAVRSRSLFKAIDLNRVIEVFNTVGYSARVPPAVITPVADEFNIRINLPVLQKGKIMIDVNTDTNSVGLIGNNLENLINEMEDVFFPKLSEIKSFSKNIWFYEIQLKLKFNGKDDSTFKGIKKTEIKKMYDIVEGVEDKMKLQGITVWNVDDPDTENFTEVKTSTDIHSTELVTYQIILRRQQELDFLDSIKKISHNLSTKFID